MEWIRQKFDVWWLGGIKIGIIHDLTTDQIMAIRKINKEARLGWMLIAGVSFEEAFREYLD